MQAFPSEPTNLECIQNDNIAVFIRILFMVKESSKNVNKFMKGDGVNLFQIFSRYYDLLFIIKLTLFDHHESDSREEVKRTV